MGVLRMRFWGFNDFNILGYVRAYIICFEEETEEKYIIKVSENI